jgi:hypothetical protein
MILSLHDKIRQAVVAACEGQSTGELAAVAAEDVSDTIYAIDKVSEAVLVEEFESWASANGPIILIAEGLPNAGVVLPAGAEASEAVLRVIVDPIDGTRGLMYQKRSAWILTGVALNNGPGTGLADLELSVMTEIPLIKQHLSDQGWATRGQGASWRRLNRFTGEQRPVNISPSRAGDIAHGFSTVSRLFPGARDVLARLDDDLVSGVLGPQPAGKALCFEDQYASSGGQMYELAAGHDRFIADIRPLIHKIQEDRGEPPCICSHPYDLAGWLLAQESGVIITGADGRKLDAPLDTTTNTAWIGYANEEIRAKVEPVLQKLMADYGLI